MRGLADYTTRARRFASRHPVLNHVSPQVSFWITAYILLSFTVHLASVNLALSFSVNIETSPLPIMLAGGITGFLYGCALGLLDYFFDKQFFRNH